MNVKDIRTGADYKGQGKQNTRRVISIGDTTKAGDRAFVWWQEVNNPLRVGSGQCTLAQFAAWAEREVGNE